MQKSTTLPEGSIWGLDHPLHAPLQEQGSEALKRMDWLLLDISGRHEAIYNMPFVAFAYGLPTQSVSPFCSDPIEVIQFTSLGKLCKEAKGMDAIIQALSTRKAQFEPKNSVEFMVNVGFFPHDRNNRNFSYRGFFFVSVGALEEHGYSDNAMYDIDSLGNSALSAGIETGNFPFWYNSNYNFNGISIHKSHEHRFGNIQLRELGKSLRRQ